MESSGDYPNPWLALKQSGGEMETDLGGEEVIPQVSNSVSSPNHSALLSSVDIFRSVCDPKNLQQDETDARQSNSVGLYNTSQNYRNMAPSGAPRLDDRLTRLLKETTADQLYYKIKGDKLKGRAVIINIKSFTGDNENRSGSDEDAVKMLGSLEALGFDVESYDNLTLREFAQLVRHLSRDPKNIHSHIDMFVMVLLSHGTQNDKQHDVILSHDSQEIPFREILSQFNGNVATTLAGKPKMFFVQACRGAKTDPGTSAHMDSMDGDESMDEADFFSRPIITIPAEADIFVAYSTPPGYYSWRSPESGSYFMQLLAYRLYHNGYKDNSDLNRIVTLVCNDMINFQSNVPKDSTMHKKKQVPWISSTLTRLVRFKKR